MLFFELLIIIFSSKEIVYFAIYLNKN